MMLNMVTMTTIHRSMTILTFTGDMLYFAILVVMMRMTMMMKTVMMIITKMPRRCQDAKNMVMLLMVTNCHGSLTALMSSLDRSWILVNSVSDRVGDNGYTITYSDDGDDDDDDDELVMMMMVIARE